MVPQAGRQNWHIETIVGIVDGATASSRKVVSSRRRAPLDENVQDTLDMPPAATASAALAKRKPVEGPV